MKPLWDWDNKESRKIWISKLLKFNLKGEGGGTKGKLLSFWLTSLSRVLEFLHSGHNRRKYGLLLPQAKSVYCGRREADDKTFETVFSKKYGRMLNFINIGLVQYKAGKMATLGTITRMVFFSHARCPQLMLTQGHNVSVYLNVVGSVARCRYRVRPRKMHSVSCGHIAHVTFLCFSSKIIFFIFP
jgi:hypothetical protein